MLRAHYRKSQHDEDLLPYIAIIHVRDSLIPPSERWVASYTTVSLKCPDSAVNFK